MYDDVEVEETVLSTAQGTNLGPITFDARLVHTKWTEDDTDTWGVGLEPTNGDDRSSICTGIPPLAHHPRLPQRLRELRVRPRRPRRPADLQTCTLTDFAEHLAYVMGMLTGADWCEAAIHLDIVQPLEKLDPEQQRDWWSLVSNDQPDPRQMLDAVVATRA